ncbi:MAG TPA: restriction endonuclease subunit S, partial [Alphaproteobacteria bacterium]|nr:restriction endonuclease subunit S [Alphaproteobacteria bacterium]
EQESITAYLEDQCQQIDSTIEETKASIEEYKVWKASIIYETVTKGLNPTVEMKDSGVQWIGEMPAKWEKIRIKYCADFAPSCDTSQFCDESIVTFAPMECIKNGYYINREGVFGNLNSSYTPFQEGDIVIAKVTPCFENGNIAIMNGLHNKFGFGSSELFVFRAKTVLPKYLFYCLQNEKLKQHACATMTGTGGLKRVSPAFLQNSYICLPGEDEQQAIADHLDKQCFEIERLMAEKQALINDLESYKRSLIYETVTGKRKVV